MKAKKLLIAIFLFASAAQAQEQPRQARNVILFLADAGGVSAVNAASLLGYGKPLKLHIQQWPHLGLSDTSPVDAYVSDSANGMSAIMTGVKTKNGVISQAGDVVRGEKACGKISPHFPRSFECA